jgi:hypothetical protein
MVEKINPLDPQYKSIEDIPEAERENYTNLPDGGFARKEVFENDKIFRKEAMERQKLINWQTIGEERKKITAADVAHEEALLIDRIRNRTAETIEGFDINEDGVAIHGTPLVKLEEILENGLGPLTKSSHVDFNLVGAQAYNPDGGPSKIGFGSDRERFGKEIVLATKIFKELWPNWINGIVKKGKATNGVFEQLEIDVDVEDLTISVRASTEEKVDWKDLEKLPLPEKKIIPEIGNEERGTNRQGEVKYGHGRLGSDYADRRSVARQLLGHWAFDAIVISDQENITPVDRSGFSQDEVLAKVIEIQGKIFPKKEHIPVYNESGKCIYNPLKET